MQPSGMTALGLVLVVLGATGASLVGRRSGPPTVLLSARLLVSGAVVGIGAALVRGWDPAGTAVLGAVLVLTVGLGGDVLRAAGRARRRRRG